MSASGPVVLKFGGTSVQDEAALARLMGIVARADEPRIVIVSALAGVTNLLVEAARAAAAGERAGSWLTPVLDRHIALARATTGGRRRQQAIDRVTAVMADAAALLSRGTVDAAGRDAVLAAGELASSIIVSAALMDAGVEAEWVDARQAIVTDERHGAARPRVAETMRAAQHHLLPLLAAGRVPVMGGFVGATIAGAATTLGRGGSDYSAGIVAAAMDASRVEIWTDVDGVLSADPRVVADAVIRQRVSDREAYDLGRFGARVLHPGTLEPVAEPRIPVVVRNTRRPNAIGTEIRQGVGSEGAPVAGLAHRADVTLIDLVSRDLAGSASFLATVEESIDHGANHSVTAVAASPRRVVLAVDEARVAHDICERLRGAAEVVSVARGGLVAVVGEGVQSEPMVWRALLDLTERDIVRRVVQSSSGVALVALTAPGAAENVMCELHGRAVAMPSAVEVA